MKCKQVKRLLVEFYEGECGEQVQADVKGHLGSCPDCSREFEEVKSVFDALRLTKSGRTSEAVGVELLAGIRTKIGEKRRRWATRLVPAFGFAVALLLAFSFFGREPSMKKEWGNKWAFASDIDYVAYLAESVSDSIAVLPIIIEDILTEDQMEELAALSLEEPLFSLGGYKLFSDEEITDWISERTESLR